MDLRNVSCLISTNGHHWEREMGAGRNLSHLIIEPVGYVQPVKMHILSTELFSVTEFYHSWNRNTVPKSPESWEAVAR